MTTRRALLALFMLIVGTPTFAIDHPIAGDALVLKDPSNTAGRKVRFKATHNAAIDPSQAGDPRSLGATLEIAGSAPGDGATGSIALDASRWTGLGNRPGARATSTWTRPARTASGRSPSARARRAARSR